MTPPAEQLADRQPEGEDEPRLRLVTTDLDGLQAATAAPPADDLKRKVVQSGTAKLVGQGANFVLRLGFLTIMARLLTPEEFGLVAMVTVVTGFYGLFTSAGLSSATVQRVTVTDAQISTL